MIEVSSGRASDAEGHFSAGGRFVRLLSDRRIRVAAAILLLAGGFNITSRAYAQTPQAALKSARRTKSNVFTMAVQRNCANMIPKPAKRHAARVNDLWPSF